MLPRAAVRALRIRPAVAAPRITSIASTSPWTRTYAKVGKPKDNTWKPTDPIKFAEDNKTSPNPTSPSEQPEFDSAAAPERNTTPSQPSRPVESATQASKDAGSDAAMGEQAEMSGPNNRKKPLPDLRYGIPSTFAEEHAEASGKAKRDPNDPNQLPDDAIPGAAGGREGGAMLLFGTTGAVFMGRNWENEEEEAAHIDAPNGWSLGAMYARAAARINGQKAYYTEPTFQKLLPDKDKIPGGAPELTLVLSLEDLLLHSEWTTKHGYRLAKRPGLDYFLRYLSSQYELVIFTSVKSMDADPIIRKLDPFRLVMWPLFREATRFEKGEYIKDLSYLNRDLSKVIILDTDPAHVKLQPENAIVMPKWKGDPNDKGLVAMIPFLEYLAMMSQTGTPIDVRTVLKSMQGKDIPVEYARREAKLREQFQRDLAEQKRKTKGSAGGMFMKSLGLDAAAKPGMQLGDQNISQGMNEGKMMIDMYREFNKQNYMHLEKQIRENGEQWLKEMAEEEKKMQEAQLKDMKAGAFGWLGAPQSSAIPSAASAPEAAASHSQGVSPDQVK
ncbi:FCP1 TFIIF-interacting CTD phosphatase NLI-interacting factor [Pyrenophora tritici-repentis]|nr:FCP1 TFIIF-interacting CTD phosphatase NLI-interacting factor [Pyrenophora tritici-repentis]